MKKKTKNKDHDNIEMELTWGSFFKSCGLGLGNSGAGFLTSSCQPRTMVTSEGQWAVLSLFSAVPTQETWKYLYR